MELKLFIKRFNGSLNWLLIVLHGIETHQVHPVFGASGLLIVLHGIETIPISGVIQNAHCLLIVLHGIETTYPRTPAYFLPFNCTTTHRLFDTDGLQRVVHIYYDKDK